MAVDAAGNCGAALHRDDHRWSVALRFGVEIDTHFVGVHITQVDRRGKMEAPSLLVTVDGPMRNCGQARRNSQSRNAYATAPSSSPLRRRACAGAA